MKREITEILKLIVEVLDESDAPELNSVETCSVGQKDMEITVTFKLYDNKHVQYKVSQVLWSHAKSQESLLRGVVDVMIRDIKEVQKE